MQITTMTQNFQKSVMVLSLPSSLHHIHTLRFLSFEIFTAPRIMTLQYFVPIAFLSLAGRDPALAARTRYSMNRKFCFSSLAILSVCGILAYKFWQEEATLGLEESLSSANPNSLSATPSPEVLQATVKVVSEAPPVVSSTAIPEDAPIMATEALPSQRPSEQPETILPTEAAAAEEMPSQNENDTPKFYKKTYFHTPFDAVEYLRSAGIYCIEQDIEGYCSKWDTDSKGIERNGLKCSNRDSEGKCTRAHFDSDLGKAVAEALVLANRKIKN